MPQLHPLASEPLAAISADLRAAIEAAPLPSLGAGPNDPTLTDVTTPA